MTPNILQNVIPRHPSKLNIPNYATKFTRRHKHFGWQQGSINSNTLTLVSGLVVIVGVAFLSFFYLGQVLNTASQGSGIQSLEEQIIDLRERQREVELEGAKLRSIETIEKRVQDLNLINTTSVSFLSKEPGKVATLSE